MNRWRTTGWTATVSHRAALDLLLRRPPRVGQATGERLRPGPEASLDACLRLGAALDRSTLAIQGPPGSGKTYSGARMALDLLRNGKRIGITANSHKVIGNFLRRPDRRRGRGRRAGPHRPEGDPSRG